MSRLLLDVGNSRVKWACLREPYRRGQAFAARGVLELEALHAESEALSGVLRAAGPLASLYVCSVAGVEVERRIRASAAGAGVRAPHFVRSAAAAAGVRNGYRDPWRLGTDRWVGLIGARHEQPGTALCIVSIGTAMTIDLLAADGRHRGGSITPGPRLMIESLLERTAGIRRRAGGVRAARAFELELGGAGRARAPRGAARAAGVDGTARRATRGAFARDTHAALLAGARYATAALIERSLLEARRHLACQPRLLLAGGAAEAIVPLLSCRYRREDDLVLRGLAVLASGSHAP